MRQARKRRQAVDAELLVHDAARLLPDPSRRRFLRQVGSLGALAMLTGCDITDAPSAEKALRKISEFNDWVQARLFNPNRLATTYPDSAVTRPFPFNAYYPEADAPDVDEERYRLILDGLGRSAQARSRLRLALPRCVPRLIRLIRRRARPTRARRAAGPPRPSSTTPPGASRRRP